MRILKRTYLNHKSLNGNTLYIKDSDEVETVLGSGLGFCPSASLFNT
jgi:hypothetical protein